MSILLRVWLCIFIFTCLLYGIIHKQNQLTRIRREIPVLMKEVRAIEEENTRLQYEVDSFESPMNLIELLRKPQYSHLKFPYRKDVTVIHLDPLERKTEEKGPQI